MKASKPYFSHDIATKSDEKIIRLMFDFRRNNTEFSESSLAPHAAYGIYWEIIEYLHENTLKVDELEMLSDVLRVDVEILEKILNNYDLFKIKDGAYISERVLRNLKLQEEKSEKARQSANKRHKGKKGEEAPQETAPEIEYDEEVALSIIQIYNDKFKKDQIVSNENKLKLFKIHTENNLTLDVWNKVFSNAKRGWDIGGKKNVSPSLKIILNEWDSFASDDYFLAPDREGIAALKEQAEKEEAIKKEQEKLAAEQHNKEREEAYNAIINAADACEYLIKYSPITVSANKTFLARTTSFKELAAKYDFTVDDFIAYREAHQATSESEDMNG